MRELRVDGSLPSGTKLRSSKYLNNLIEQDHRGVKQRIAVMLGFKETRRHHDRRYRADASHSQRTVPTGPAGCTRSNCAFGLERRDRSLKSRFDAEGCICFCGLFAPEPGSLRCCGRTPSRCCGCHSAACHSSRERGSDESTIAMIAQYGRIGWQRRSGYNRRSLVETAIYRYKTMIGRRPLRSESAQSAHRSKDRTQCAQL